MNDLKSELSKMIPLYCGEIENIEASEYENVVFSDEFESKMAKLIRTRKKSRSAAIKITGRKIAALIAAAVLMGTIAAAAYAPARNAFKRFFINTFGGYSVVVPSGEDDSAYRRPDTIERIYSVEIPEGFTLDGEESYTAEDYSELVYYTEDGELCVCFSQFTENAYKSYFNDEYGEIVQQTDSAGNEVTVYKNTDESFVSLIWDNGEYIFELNGNLSEKQLMEIYYTVH